MPNVGALSATAAVPSYVIQGSSLTFALFTVYIDSLSFELDITSISYADDLKFIANLSRVNHKLVQANIDSVHKWSVSRGMLPSIDKCLVLYYVRSNPLWGRPQSITSGCSLEAITLLFYCPSIVQCHTDFRFPSPSAYVFLLHSVLCTNPWSQPTYLDHLPFIGYICSHWWMAGGHGEGVVREVMGCGGGSGGEVVGEVAGER